MPVVSIHLEYLRLIVSFLSDERGTFRSSSLPLHFPSPQTIALLHSSPPLLPTCLSSSVLFVSRLSSSTHLPWGADTNADCEQKKGEGC